MHVRLQERVNEEEVQKSRLTTLSNLCARQQADMVRKQADIAPVRAPLPAQPLSLCILMALTYGRTRRTRA